MNLGEAKELLKEMQENCKSKTIYKDEKAEAKAEAIEVVLKELDEKDELLHNTVEYNAVKQKEWILKDIKKDKVIDKMLNLIIRISIRVPGSVFRELKTNGFNDSLCEHCKGKEISCKKCIKDYFYKKVEEQE